MCAVTDPTTIEHSFIVENECHGWRLDRFLKKRIPRMSRVRLQRVIRGDCEVDGRAGKPSLLVAPGQRVTFRRPAPVEPEFPRALPLVYEDAAFYVFDKPAGLTMHPTAKYYHGTVTSVLREHFPSEALQITHRLDRETSGLILVARNYDAAVNLKRAFARRLVKKRYLAIVHGKLEGEGVIDAPIDLEPAGRVRVRMAVSPSGQPSRTRYRALEYSDEHSLVECFPETGRQHQIRVHLSHIGHAIVGDKLYPDENIFADYQEQGWSSVADRVPLPRHALHAAQIEFPHPLSGVPVMVKTDLATDLARFFYQLNNK